MKGQLHGTISYVVTSVNGPAPRQPARRGADRDRLPRAAPAAVPGITDSDISGGNDWVFAYHAAHGSMTQRYDTDPTTWGNITG